MTTYQVVVVLVAGAVALVLVALWQLGPRRAHPGTPRWVALGSSFAARGGDPSWVSAVRLDRPASEAIDLTAPGAGVAEVISSQLGPALSAQPAAAVIWLGADDLLRGRPLTHFMVDLAHVVDRLRNAGCAVVLVDLPELRWEAPSRAGRPDRALRARTTEWRAALTELARSRAVPLVTPGAPDQPVVALAGARLTLSPPDREAVGLELAGEVGRALRTGGSEAFPEAADPEDPAVRRRLGLPRTR